LSARAVQTLSLDEVHDLQQGFPGSPTTRTRTGRAARAYSPRPSDSVSSTRQPEPDRRDTAATASRRFWNSPNTVDPLPVMAAAIAPARRNAAFIWSISG